jgi:hypothetical protein
LPGMHGNEVFKELHVTGDFINENKLSEYI